MIRRILFGAAVLGLGCASASLAGCYKRVVRAEGFGQDRADIYEPNLEEPHDRQARPHASSENQKQRQRARGSGWGY